MARKPAGRRPRAEESSLFTEIKAFMRTGTSMAIGGLVCILLLTAVIVTYLHYKDEYEKRIIIVEEVLKIRNFMIKREPLLDVMTDEEILQKTQKLADEFATWAINNSELKLAIEDITRKLQSGWVLEKGSIYFFQKTRDTWQNSEEFCSEQNATLPCVESVEEERFIESTVKGHSVEYWLGVCYKDNKWICYEGNPDRGERLWRRGHPKIFTGSCAVLMTKCMPRDFCWEASLVNDTIKRSICRQKPNPKWAT